jgi:hypothetical protein
MKLDSRVMKEIELEDKRGHAVYGDGENLHQYSVFPYAC